MALEPAPPSALAPRQILVNNERVKLTANLINAVAGAFIIGGGAGAYATFGASFDLAVAPDAVGRAALWISIGGAVHWVARRMLRYLL